MVTKKSTLRGEALRLSSALLLIGLVLVSTGWCQGAAEPKPPAAGAGQPAVKQPAPAAPGAAEPAPAAPAAKQPAPKELPQLPLGPEPYLEKECVDSLKNQYGDVRDLLEAGSIPADKVEAFETFYKRYALARWTLEGNLEQVGSKLRNDLRNDFYKASKAPRPDAHQRLTALVLETMRELADDHYHPVVRYNAMRQIADLSRLVQQGDKFEQVPLPDVVPVLVEEINDPDQIDAVKAAALVGLLQRAKADPTLGGEQNRGQVAAAMFQLAATKHDAAPEDRSADGHAYFRALAVEILAEMGIIGQNGQPVVMLAEVVRDPDSRVYTRCAALEAMGRFDYPAENPLDGAEVLDAAAQLAAAASRAEIEYLTTQLAKLQDTEVEDPMRGRLAPGEGMGPEIDRRPFVKQTARLRLARRLASVWLGLNGPAPNSRQPNPPPGLRDDDLLASQPLKDYAAALSQTLEEAVSLLNKDDLDEKLPLRRGEEDELVTRLKQIDGALRQLAANVPKAPAAKKTAAAAP